MASIKDRVISPDMLPPISMITCNVKCTHKYGHIIQLELVVDFLKIVARTTCSACHTFLDEKVIYEVPQSIIEEKCLPVCVDSVKS